MSAQSIAQGLRGRQSGRGWIARCPAHQDETPSLSIAERGGKVLVHCHAGCDQRSIIAALQAQGLWAEREQRSWTVAARREWVREQEEMRAAGWWARAAVALGQELLEQLDSADPARDPVTRLLRSTSVGGQSLLDEFRAWQTTAPELAAAMVRAGKNSDARLQRSLAALVSEWNVADAAWPEPTSEALAALRAADTRRKRQNERAAPPWLLI